MRWETNKIIKLLSKVDGIKNIKSAGPGGDYDTSKLIIAIDNGETLYLSGFRYGKTLVKQEWDNCNNISFLELTAGLDSRGGIEGCKKPNTFTVFGKIKILLQKMGFEVANSYREHW